MEFIYVELSKNIECAQDFVTGICTLWPINASYPIHLGAMLQMIIEDKTKYKYYGFIIDHPHYNILSNQLQQYSGIELQAHIKQLANLCNLWGSNKFSLLSLSILDSFRNLLKGGKFELDIAPLLKQQQQQQQQQQPQQQQQQQQFNQNKEVFFYFYILSSKCNVIA